MPLFVAALVGALAQAAGSIVGRVLLAIGIGFVTYNGIQLGFSTAEAGIRNAIGGLPSDAIQFLAFCGIDRALSMIFSAVAISVAIKGLTGGSLTKMVAKK